MTDIKKLTFRQNSDHLKLEPCTVWQCLVT